MPKNRDGPAQYSSVAKRMPHLNADAYNCNSSNMNNPTAPPLQSIYPVLEGPQDDQVLVATEQKTCRLQHISRLQRQLEEERDLRAALYKKNTTGV